MGKVEIWRPNAKSGASSLIRCKPHPHPHLQCQAGATWAPEAWGIKPKEVFMPAPFSLVSDMACGPCLALNARSAHREQQKNLTAPMRPRGKAQRPVPYNSQRETSPLAWILKSSAKYIRSHSRAFVGTAALRKCRVQICTMEREASSRETPAWQATGLR